MTPSICRMVVAHVDPLTNNGSDEAPAVITRVWGQMADGDWTVNLQVFLDSPTGPVRQSSVRLCMQRPNEIKTATAWWPPRVQ